MDQMFEEDRGLFLKEMEEENRLENSYVYDTLIKYHCLECDKDFIISEYQAADILDKIRCPYCRSRDLFDSVFMEDEDDLSSLGCLGIGHHTNQELAKMYYELGWGKIKKERNLK